MYGAAGTVFLPLYGSRPICGGGVRYDAQVDSFGEANQTLNKRCRGKQGRSAPSKGGKDLLSYRTRRVFWVRKKPSSVRIEAVERGPQEVNAAVASEGTLVIMHALPKGLRKHYKDLVLIKLTVFLSLLLSYPCWKLYGAVLWDTRP